MGNFVRRFLSQGHSRAARLPVFRASSPLVQAQFGPVTASAPVAPVAAPAAAPVAPVASDALPAPRVAALPMST